MNLVEDEKVKGDDKQEDNYDNKGKKHTQMKECTFLKKNQKAF